MSFQLALNAFSGVAGIASGLRGSSSGRKLNKRALKLQEEELRFARERYNRFLSIYGPIEENLGDFFFRLTPGEFASRGLAAFEKQFRQSQEKLDEFFAQNEIDTGVRIDVKAKQELEAAETRASIVADAPFKLAEAQSNFLALGLGREASAAGARSNAGVNLSNLLTNQANQAREDANIGFDAAAIAFSNLAEDLDRRDEETAASGSPQLN